MARNKYLDGPGTKAVGQTPASHSGSYDDLSPKKLAQIEAARADSKAKSADPDQEYGAQRSGKGV